MGLSGRFLAGVMVAVFTLPIFDTGAARGTFDIARQYLDAIVPPRRTPRSALPLVASHRPGGRRGASMKLANSSAYAGSQRDSAERFSMMSPAAH